MSLRKLFLALGLLLLIGVWGACVDIPDSGTGFPDFRSQVRFVHAVPGGAAGEVKVDGATIGNLTAGAATGYSDVASGSRSVAFGASPAQSVTFGSEQQSSVLVYQADAAGTIAYLNLNEGHKDKNNGIAGVAKVRFVNAAQGVGTVTFRADSATGTALQTGVAFASLAQYANLDSTARARAAHAVFAVSDSGSIASIGTAAYDTGRMYTLIATGSGATFQIIRLEDRRAGN